MDSNSVIAIVLASLLLIYVAYNFVAGKYDWRSGWKWRDPHTAVAGKSDNEPILEAASMPLDRPNAGGIFISYRRTDEPNFAGRLEDRLTQRFGNSRVFMDVDSIELGLDFAEAINDYLAGCEALIAVIGKGWLGAADDDGRRRLENPSDYVRLEIETALRRNIRVIPVVVEGAHIPHVEELPPSMESLARRNGIEMSHANFGSDTAKLIATLDRIMKGA